MLKPIFLDMDSKDFSGLSEVLVSTSGYNRSNEPNMLLANTDAQAIATFLQDYQTQKLTYRSYIKEIERLILWASNVPKLSISDLKREHLISYQQFILDPTPKKLWCGSRESKLKKDGSINLKWKPFACPLSSATARKVSSILDSFFNYLVQNNYLAGNPMVRDKRRKGIKSRSTERWVEIDEINMTLEALSAYQSENENNSFQAIRAKYIILTLFFTGLRLAEFANHKMGDFVTIDKKWYLNIIGKGQKPRKIVVVDEYLDLLAEFRKTIPKLTPLPKFDEQTPLVPMESGKQPISESRIWQIVKWAFEMAANRYEAIKTLDLDEQRNNAFKGSKLRKASPHWLRHSYGTYLVKSGCAIEKVKQLMGHSDISTTMVYVHIANDDLHLAAQNLSLQEE